MWTAAAIFGGTALGIALGFDPLALLTDEHQPSIQQAPNGQAEPETETEIGVGGSAESPPTSTSEPEVTSETARPAPAKEEVLAAGHQPTLEQRPASSLHPSVAAEAVERMEQIVTNYEAAFPWVRAAWEVSTVLPFDETLDAPCGDSGHGCMIHRGGGLTEVWISLDTIRDEPPSDFDLLWGSPKRSLESVLLHELAHVLDLTTVGDAIDRGDAFRAATQGFRDHYAGCRFDRFDTERSVHELLAETIAQLTAGHSFRRWTELDGCLATLPPPDEHIDNLGFALAGCGSVGSLDDLGRDRTAMWCPDEFTTLETERQEMASAEAEARAAEEAEAAEAAARALAAQAEAAARALAVECGDDLNIYGGPGWEHGCKEAGHVPDEVPCLVPLSMYSDRGWLPGYIDDRNDRLPDYFNGNGECRANVALTSAPRAWRDCLPDDGGRWTGDWSADPYNSRYPCQKTLAAECANDVNRSPRLPQMHWGDTDGNRWPPGWEEGCKEAGMIPNGVPCVVSAAAALNVVARHGWRE